MARPSRTVPPWWLDRCIFGLLPKPSDTSLPALAHACGLMAEPLRRHRQAKAGLRRPMGPHAERGNIKDDIPSSPSTCASPRAPKGSRSRSPTAPSTEGGMTCRARKPQRRCGIGGCDYGAWIDEIFLHQAHQVSHRARDTNDGPHSDQGRIGAQYLRKVLACYVT
jgi:hypothetical protein